MFLVINQGAFTSASLSAITTAILAGKFAAYKGICYDIEEGEAGLSALFQQSFAACKSMGLLVLVTISHSQPYGISDAVTLMQGVIADPNVDYLSPQLYSSGYEPSNDFSFIGTPWTAYAASTARIVPSIVAASYYPDAVRYFAAQGVTLTGYIQWKQGA